jgi:pyruvate dehydrogenase E1 component alpha subunit
MQDFYKKIIINRTNQLIINELMKKNKLKSVVHLAIGHEFISELISSCIKENDDLLLTHRNISFNLAREKNFKKVLAELNYLNSGISSGQMGSMNMNNIKKNIIYSSSILGNNLSIALGASIANSKLSNQRNQTFIVTGDGAMEEGSFYETLILAKSIKTSLCILVINDNFAMASTIKERRHNIDLRKICKSMNIDYLNYNQHEAFNKVNLIQTILLKNRKEKDLCVLEFNVETFNGHCGKSPGWPEDPKNIDLQNGIIIKKSNRDIVFILKDKIGYQHFKSVEKKALTYANKILREY